MAKTILYDYESPLKLTGRKNLELLMVIFEELIIEEPNGSYVMIITDLKYHPTSNPTLFQVRHVLALPQHQSLTVRLEEGNRREAVTGNEDTSGVVNEGFSLSIHDPSIRL